MTLPFRWILRLHWVPMLMMCFSCVAPVAGGGLRDVRARMTAKTRPTVLFIGNSYTFGLPKAFAQSAAAVGQTVEVAHATQSGRSLAQHARDPKTISLLRSRRWDVVVLQETSLTPADPIKRRLSMLPAVRTLADEARQVGALPVLYQTWGRRDGAPMNPNDDFYQMNRRVREGYAMVSQKSGFLPIIPVGDAWENEFRAGRGEALYLPDGSHPSPRGVRVTAETFRQALIP